jgi:hypothetical protein
MRKRIAVLLVMGLGAVVLAQKQPDFTGVWIPEMPKPQAEAATGGAVDLPPSDLTIQHTAAVLAISRMAFDTVNTQTFKFDGSENTNKSGAVTRLSRTRWDGPRLVIEGKASQVTSAGYDAWTFKDAYSIDARGRLIVQAEHIPTDGQATTRTMTYTRKPSK